MRELSHGRLKLQVPDDWHDQSTLLFVAPRAAAETVPRAQVTPTLSVHFAFGAGLAANQLVDQETGKLARLDPAVERRPAQPFASPLGEGALQEVRFTLSGVPVAQLAVAWVVGELGVIACASCGARELEAERPRLEALLRAVKL